MYYYYLTKKEDTKLKKIINNLNEVGISQNEIREEVIDFLETHSKRIDSKLYEWEVV